MPGASVAGSVDAGLDPTFPAKDVSSRTGITDPSSN